MNIENKIKWQEKIENLSNEVLQRGANLSTKLPALGHVCLLYSQLDTHKHLTFDEIESRILPALLQQQCKLYVQPQVGGLPMGFVSWAHLCAEQEERYVRTKKLSPAAWQSGDKLWLVDVVLPYGGQQRVFNEIQNQLFQRQTVNTFVSEPNGEVRRTTVSELLASNECARKFHSAESQVSASSQH